MTCGEHAFKRLSPGFEKAAGGAQLGETSFVLGGRPQTGAFSGAVWRLVKRRQIENHCESVGACNQVA